MRNEVGVKVSVLNCSEPTVVLIPFDGEAHSMVEVVFGMEAQFVFGRSDVTTPVALLHDMVFVVVEGCHLACHPAYVFSAEGYEAK